MPFPLVPVMITAGLSGLGYLLFKPDAAAAQGGATPASPAPKSPAAASTAKLPTVKRPADLPPPAPMAPAAPIMPAAPVMPASPILPNPPPLSLPLPIPFSPPLPQPAPVAPTDQTGLVIAPSGVNLRNAPNTSGTVLAGLVAGTRVKILRYDSTPTTGAPKGWYQVTAPNGMTGYATAEYILPDNGSNPVPVPMPIPIPSGLPAIPSNLLPGGLSGALGGLSGLLPSPASAGVTTGKILGTPGANLRSSPSTSGAIVKGLFNGTIVTVLSTTLAPPSAGATQGWVNVKDSTGATGWVSREFCAPASGASFGRDPFHNSGGLRYRKKSAITA